MSGTSMDGIDAALVDTDGRPSSIKFIGHYSLSYSTDFKTLLKAAEYAVRSTLGDLQKARLDFPLYLEDYLLNFLVIDKGALTETIQRLSSYLQTRPSLDAIIHHSTELHAIAVNKLLKKMGLLAKDIAVIGYHGQTLFHDPANKISIIVGDGAYLAKTLGIKVVNDFRSKDIQNGGQGAPLAPLYHQALAIRDKHIPLALVNCGGIANLSVISTEEEGAVIGFDTGPGNGLIDRLVRIRTQGKEDMDKDGIYGKRGIVREDILALLFKKSVEKEGTSYFQLPPPKSLDIGDLKLISELDDLSLEDACKTLEAFTAKSIVESLQFVKVEVPKLWVLAGGGWYNPIICEQLKLFLGESIHVKTADEMGWSNASMEAELFAYLAVRRLFSLPTSYPSITKVSRPISCGTIYEVSTKPTF